MQAPTRKTRKNLAYWLMGLLTSVMVYIFLPGDIGQQEAALLMILTPSLAGTVAAYISAAAYAEHSKNKHGVTNDD